MTASFALILTKRAVCFALFLQALEIFRLAKAGAALQIWNFKTLRSDLERALPLSSSFIGKLFADESLRLVAGVQCGLALAGFLFPLAPFIVIIFFTHLLICVRFRGVFNGGSDIMAFVIMTGILIASLPNARAHQLGLLYIAIHGLYSYVRAGAAKITKPAWRTGAALPAFLSRSLYPDVRSFARWMSAHRSLSAIACWGVMLFELSALLIPFIRGWALVYFVCAMAFHLVVYFSFGLNRFFWVWLSVWPSIFYAVSLRWVLS